MLDNASYLLIVLCDLMILNCLVILKNHYRQKRQNLAVLYSVSIPIIDFLYKI